MHVLLLVFALLGTALGIMFAVGLVLAIGLAIWLPFAIAWEKLRGRW